MENFKKTPIIIKITRENLKLYIYFEPILLHKTFIFSNY